ncbi:MAG: patatin-like phospholipase family protein [Deltaproteobacteria bacterium]|jgi:predicted acylesterase/phospholipase RssA|nr:patatin-like phospholipase family protein [Deltaproteobacteria bacterium]
MSTVPKSKSALVLAGGGMTGAAYEIGALNALDRLFDTGFSVSDFDIYLGTSAGSILATLLANRVVPADIFQAIARDKPSLFNWRREDIYRIDRRELVSNLRAVFVNVFRIIKTHRLHRWDLSLSEILHIFQEQLPAGLYSLDPLQGYLCKVLRDAGLHDEFDRIEAELYIAAYNLDTLERVIFGLPPYRNLHVCRAIAASCAYPLFFRPYIVDGHHYVDGAIGRADHIDVAIDRGATLIVMINPRVPIDNRNEDTCLPSLSLNQCASVSELGATFAWEQAGRIENREKMKMALEILRLKHPEVDIVLFEPSKAETLHFFQGPMSDDARKHIMISGSHQTALQLQASFDEYQTVFARHGIPITKSELKTGFSL